MSVRGFVERVRVKAVGQDVLARELDRHEAWVGFRPWLPDHLPAIGASYRKSLSSSSVSR